jgi:ferredoxin
MDIHSATLIYFSPTQTTKKIVEAIARGLHVSTAEHVDLTRPDAKSVNIGDAPGELAIIASPVYGGRLPLDMISRLQGHKGKNAPVVVVVVYGNRAYEDALLELSNLALAAGFKPIAAGAFIGEHSYSSSVTPIAAGRPDRGDLRKAEEFGEMIHKKFSSLRASSEISPLHVPGNYPYKERKLSSNISPVTRGDLCNRCEDCAAVCPTAAITFGELVMTDKNACIRCCACIRACPTGARVMDDPHMAQLSQWLNANCQERKEPETYM